MTTRTTPTTPAAHDEHRKCNTSNLQTYQPSDQDRNKQIQIKQHSQHLAPSRSFLSPLFESCNHHEVSITQNIFGKPKPISKKTYTTTIFWAIPRPNINRPPLTATMKAPRPELQMTSSSTPGINPIAASRARIPQPAFTTSSRTRLPGSTSANGIASALPIPFASLSFITARP